MSLSDGGGRDRQDQGGVAADLFSGVRGNELKQDWSLDAVGNWPSSTLNGTAQARDHSKANEVSTVNSSSTDVGNDLAGNLTKMPRLVGNDVVGHYVCVYDAWNRLIKLQSEGTTPTVYATMAYDGRGRRISKAITNSGDLNCTYHYYLDGDSMIEVRNGSDQVLKQQVWGVTYIDELVQQCINGNPTADNTCETAYWACQDANYDVCLLVDNQGNKVERYAYTPYGVRTAYKASDGGDVQLTLAVGSSQAVMVGATAQPYGLCEFGHQGLQHDEESGLIYNWGRMLHPALGRFVQLDPTGYPNGMNAYEYVTGAPVAVTDPSGLDAERHLKAWEKVSDTIYRATMDGAGLDRLADVVIGDPESGQCIWPVLNTITDEAMQSRMYAKKEAECGSTWDVSNLITASKKEYKAILIDVQTRPGQIVNRDILQLYTGISPENEFTSNFGAKKLAQDIQLAADFGQAPIGTFWLGSHNGGQGANGGGSFTLFGPDTLDEYASHRYGKWNWKEIKDKHSPPRGWFAPGTDLRLIGCNSAGAAWTWKRDLLRNAPGLRSQAWGTTGYLHINFVGKNRGTLAWVGGQNEIEKGVYKGVPPDAVGFDQFFNQKGWWEVY